MALKRVTTGRIADYLPLNGDRQLPWLISSLVVASLVSIFFIIAPIVLLFIWIVKRKKMKHQSTLINRERRLYWGSILMGTIILLNNILLIVRSMMSNSMLSYDGLKIHIVFNWILFIGVLLLVILNLLNWKNTKLKMLQKTMRTTTFVFIALFITVLFNWNYFNFY